MCYLETLRDIAGDKSSTIVLPFPSDLPRTLATLGAAKAGGIAVSAAVS